MAAWNGIQARCTIRFAPGSCKRLRHITLRNGVQKYSPLKVLVLIRMRLALVAEFKTVDKKPGAYPQPGRSTTRRLTLFSENLPARSNPHLAIHGNRRQIPFCVSFKDSQKSLPNRVVLCMIKDVELSRERQFEWRSGFGFAFR